MNICFFIGNLVRDCDLKKLSNGNLWGLFTIAVNGKNDDVLFLDCNIFGKLAEKISPYLKKGKSVLVSGELRDSSYTNKQGQKINKVSLTVKEIKLLGGVKSKTQNNYYDYNEATGEVSDTPINDNNEEQYPFWVN